MVPSKLAFYILVIITISFSINKTHADPFDRDAEENNWKDLPDSEFKALPASELANNPSDTITNWNRLSPNQKKDIYQNYLTKPEFKDKFASEYGITISSDLPDASFDGTTLSIGNTDLNVNDFKDTGYSFAQVNGQLQITDKSGNTINLDGTTENPSEIAKTEENILIDSASFEYTSDSGSTQLSSAQNIIINDEYLSAQSARLFTYTTPDKSSILSASNVENLVITNNNIQFDHSDSLTTNQNWLGTNLDSFSGNTLEFSLDHSDLIIVNGITLTYISNVTISKDNSKTTILSPNNTSLTDSFGISSILAGNLSISKQNTYTLSGKLQIIQSNYTENIISNNSIITLNPYLGIECITFTGISSYTYSDKNNINKDFAIKNNNPSHTLCLKKDNTNYITNLNNSLFDFINNKANLNSKLQFLKYPIKQNNIISLAFTSLYTSNNLNYANLTFNNQLTIINKINTFPSQTTLTNPSKAFAIKEHLNTTFVKLNLNSYSQPQILNYNDKIQINNNILMNNKLKCIKT